MTYDSPFWAIEEEVIPEVANFKEEGLVTQKDEKEKKKFWKFMVHAGNWTQVTWIKCQSADHYTIQRLLSEEVDFNNMY